MWEAARRATEGGATKRRAMGPRREAAWWATEGRAVGWREAARWAAKWRAIGLRGP